MSNSEPTYTFRVNIVLLRENDLWIAQGLDFDITGHGARLNDALDNLEQTFVGQILIDIQHGEKPLGNTPPAPKFYWDKFREASKLSEKREKRFSLPEGVLPAYMIETTDLRIDA